jgi:hypothetical protein
VALIALLVTHTASAAEPTSASSIPPPAPLNEQVIDPNADFLTACMSRILPLAQKFVIRLGKSLFTYSDEFGNVLRIDFTFFDQDLSPSINRIICDQPSPGKLRIGFAIGQKVKPL